MPLGLSCPSDDPRGTRGGAATRRVRESSDVARRASKIASAQVLAIIAVAGAALAHPAGRRCLERLRGGAAAHDVPRAPYVEMLSGEQLPEPLVAPNADGEMI